MFCGNRWIQIEVIFSEERRGVRPAQLQQGRRESNKSESEASLVPAGCVASSVEVEADAN